ncbi:MAG: hypothetical protein ACD_39C01832G0006 [uncultured bacterium]|nr:MAG: hypothetical protein ACD_39C01832G0006 [uncultured bacterium]
MKSDYFNVEGPVLNSGEECEKILRQLPEWFGIENALAGYREEIDTLPTFLIKRQQQNCGFICLKTHFKESVELYVLGLLPEFHRHGIGRAAIESVTEYYRSQGVEYIQVKTVSSSNKWPEYEKTRSFYLSLGFRPLEIIPAFWGEGSPCLQMIKKISQ